MSFELILDVAIGLVLIFALFSLLASTVVELISASLRRRGRMQEFGISQLLDGEKLKRPFWSNCLGGRAYSALPAAKKTSLTERFYELEPIKVLMDQERLPSYIGKDAFVAGVMSLIHEDLELPAEEEADYGVAARNDKSGSRLVKIIRELFPNQSVSRAMLEKRLRIYYKDATERIIGWYARETQIWLFVIGALIAVTFNVNTIYMTSEIASNANLREQLVAAATSDAEIAALAESATAAARVEEFDAAADYEAIIKEKRAEIKKINSTISKLDLPIGMCREFGGDGGASSDASAATVSEETMPILLVDTMTHEGAPKDICDNPPFSGAYFAALPVAIVGWFLTAVAISLGAPFWFDLLSKLVAIRRAGKLKEPKDEEKEDKETDEAPVTDARRRHDAGVGDGATLPLAPNDWERDNLSEDDIKDVQRLIGAGEITGDLASAATRRAIKEWKSANAYSVPDGFLSQKVVLDIFQ